VPITAANPFKGRQYPGAVILTAVRWYLRSPLAYEHGAELLTERGLPVDGGCVWHWVQAYAPELTKCCRQHLKTTNKSYRVGLLSWKEEIGGFSTRSCSLSCVTSRDAGRYADPLIFLDYSPEAAVSALALNI